MLEELRSHTKEMMSYLCRRRTYELSADIQSQGDTDKVGSVRRLRRYANVEQQNLMRWDLHNTIVGAWKERRS